MANLTRHGQFYEIYKGQFNSVSNIEEHLIRAYQGKPKSLVMRVTNHHFNANL